MKRVLLILLLASLAISPWANARDNELMSTQVAENVEHMVRDMAELAKFESKLLARLQQTPADSPDAAGIQTELEEVRLMRESYEQFLKEARKLLAELGPERQVHEALAKDKRRPTKTNVSGVWCSSPNMVGYVVQLEQKGELITGQGYHWGCLGTIGTFTVDGTYHDTTLSVRFDEPDGRQTKSVFRYAEEKPRHPRFQAVDSKGGKYLTPAEH